MVDAESVLSASSGEKRSVLQLPSGEQEFIRRAFHVEHDLFDSGKFSEKYGGKQ